MEKRAAAFGCRFLRYAEREQNIGLAIEQIVVYIRAFSPSRAHLHFFICGRIAAYAQFIYNCSAVAVTARGQEKTRCNAVRRTSEVASVDNDLSFTVRFVSAYIRCAHIDHGMHTRYSLRWQYVGCCRRHCRRWLCGCSSEKLD